MGVPLNSEPDTPFACPHCGTEMAASHATPGNVGRALREKIALPCPHCGQEFYITLDPGDALMTYVVTLDPAADDDAARDARTERTVRTNGERTA